MNEPRECEVCLKEFDLDTEGFLNILEICEADDKAIEDYEEEKLKDHVVYARIIQDFDRLERNYKLMDLGNPLLDENDKEFLEEIASHPHSGLNTEAFLRLYNEDGIGKMIRNVDFWLKDIFKVLNSFNK